MVAGPEIWKGRREYRETGMILALHLAARVRTALGSSIDRLFGLGCAKLGQGSANYAWTPRACPSFEG